MTHHPSTTRDFDFLHGQWLAVNRRLRQPPGEDGGWDAFDAWYRCWPLLEGIGHVAEMQAEEALPFCAVLHSFDSGASCWNLHRLGADGSLAPPLAGSFRGGVGRFYGERRAGGRRVLERHTWVASAEAPHWYRAFSADGGATWQDDWVMTLQRVHWPLEIEVPARAAVRNAARPERRQFDSKRRSVAGRERRVG